MAKPQNGTASMAISNAITRMHRDHYGRGATRTRTTIHDEYVMVFLEDVYTPVERTLLDAGREETVRDTRQAFQQAMRKTFSDAVEQATGRKVVAFMSQTHVNPDLSVEVFVLEPTSPDEPIVLDDSSAT
jgi:uncharacterized protein YbcI